MSKAEEVDGSAVVSGGEPTEVFEPIEASLDAITMLVGFSIVGNGDLPCRISALACIATIVWRKALLS